MSDPREFQTHRLAEFDTVQHSVEWHVYASPVLETLIGMQCLLLNWYEPPWKQKAQETLGADYLSELREVFEPYRNGTDLFEAAVATEHHEDLDAFVSYLRSCSTEEFSHYVFGQIVPEGKSIRDLEPGDLRALFENYGEYAHYLDNMRRLADEQSGGQWFTALDELKERFARLVERFWHEFFKQEMEALRLRWNMSVAKNESYAEEHGALELLALVTEQRKLPPMVPLGEALRRIDFVPIVHLPTASTKYIANGTITCLYKADRTEDRLRQLHETELDAIRIAKALGDGTRMHIMKLIYQHPHALNGQNVAELTGLAKSVVSKHLRQLIDAGLVIEQTRDRRNNIYTVREAAIRRFSEQLMEVLRG